MKLAQSSHQKLETFWREYLDDESFVLPQIKIYRGRFSRILARILKIDGITFGRRIFIAPKLVTRDSKHQLKISSELIAHEIAHTLQYRREGFFRFLFQYLRYFRQNMRKKEKWDSSAIQNAYWNIPFEIEAREVTKSLAVWKKDLESEL